MQERRNSIANALELRLSCTNPPTCLIVVASPRSTQYIATARHKFSFLNPDYNHLSATKLLGSFLALFEWHISCINMIWHDWYSEKSERNITNFSVSTAAACGLALLGTTWSLTSVTHIYIIKNDSCQMLILSSLVPEVVVITTSGADSHNNVGITRCLCDPESSGTIGTLLAHADSTGTIKRVCWHKPPKWRPLKTCRALNSQNRNVSVSTGSN